MGPQLYGLFISFQALISLGTLGDLGLGGSVNIEANRMLGARKFDDLRNFLRAAQTVFFILALAIAVSITVLAPCLSRTLGFTDKLGNTALPLFFVGAFIVGVTILANFTSGLSNACSNLTWPILPNLLALQVALAMHLCLAKAGSALWIQFLPYACLAIVTLILPWLFTKYSHPELAGFGLIRVGWSTAWRLISQSFWVYLWTFGFLVYTTTDRLVINRFFGPEQTSRYYLNYKPCELAVFTLAGLTFFSLNKIIQWYWSPDLPEQRRAVNETLRLQNVSIFLASLVSLAYLAFNDIFIYLWLGPGNGVALALQAVFAANLAVTISGDTGTKIAGQISQRGTVFAGLMVATTGLINLLLSLLAAKAGLILGIAAATLVAQAFFGITTGCFTASHLGVSKIAWVIKTTALPTILLGVAFLVRSYLIPVTWFDGLLLSLAFFALLLGVAFLLRIDRGIFIEEWRIFRSMVRR